MSPTATNRVASALATWLLIMGISGLVSPVVMGIFTTNRVHAVIQLLLAIWGFKAAFTTGARGFLWAFSVFALLTGLLFFIPGGQEWTDFLAVNQAGAVLNLALGSVALLFAGIKPR